MKDIKSTVSLLLCLFMAGPLFSGPTIIRDNRVTDIAATPMLGRGYSIATNTFQSACMSKVIITEPSYDLKYSFTQVEDKGSETKSTEEQKNKDQSSSMSQKSSTKTKGATWGLGATWGKGSASSASGINSSLKGISKTTTIEGKTWYSHSMVVSISLSTYYASVDESRSKLSAAAKKLLQTKDLPGFFSSCGPYYVRSIGRNATFYSIFTYSSEKETRDEAFDDQLRTEVTKFSTSSAKDKAAGFTSLTGLDITIGSTKSKASLALSSKDIAEQNRKEAFNRQAENYRLTINTSAYGLGKDKKATLVSFDMDSFKAAVTDAFASMQNPHTGKVSSVEVVPWIENTEFQALLKLEEEELPSETPGALPEGIPEQEAPGDIAGPKPKTKLLYEKKHILNLNAEFFMEIERADRNKLNMYYKARLCRKNIDMRFKDGNEIKEKFIGIKLANHLGRSPATIEYLDEKLTSEMVDDLYQKEQDFMYGVKDNEEDLGASECIRQIMQQGIFEKSYREIQQCQKVSKELGDVQSNLLESYCMPEFDN